MKAMVPCAAAIATAWLISTTNVQAQYYTGYQPYYPGTFYLNAEIGGTLLRDLNVKNTGTRLSFDPGSRVDFSFGYNIVPQVSVGFETGVIWNSVDRANGVSLSSMDERADLYQVPFLANLIFRAPLPGGFSAYLGAGAGGVASTFDLRQDQVIGGTEFRFHDRDSDFTFAYEGMAGLKYAFGWNMEVGVGYKFMGTLNHTWFEGDPNLETRTGHVYSHSILATFTWGF
jgi:opacity protein-like surface antigen